MLGCLHHNIYSHDAQNEITISVIIGTTLFLIGIYVHHVIKSRKSQTQTFKYPPGGCGKWPIVGDTLQLLNSKTMALYQIESRRKYGPIWRTNVLFQNAVFVSGCSHLKELSNHERSHHNNTSACFPPHHKKLFGPNSILVLSGEKHSRIRSLIVPTLSPAFYTNELEVAAKEFVHRCKTIHDPVSDTTSYFQLVPLLKQYTLRVALRVILGEEGWEQQLDDINVYKESLLQDVQIWSLGLLAPPTTFIPWSTAGKAMKARARVSKVIQHFIQLERTSQNNKIATSTPVVKKQSLLQKLVWSQDDDGNFLSDDVIIDNIFTLIFAGTDTTASILTSCFLELSSNNAVRQRLKESINDTNILLAFISEIQRIKPAAPFTMRVISGDQGVRVANYDIPPSYLATYAIAGTLLDDETMYPNPSVFDMDRWLVGQNSPPPIWAFGGGSRICPGRFLSNAEVICLLQAVLGDDGFDWEIRLDQDLSYRYMPGFFPKDFLYVRLVRS